MTSSTTMSYQNLKMASTLKDAEQSRATHREKALLVFTFQLLVDKGYFNAASALSKESSMNLDEFSVCENIDLHSIFVEFETYYHLRYQRYPQYFKKTGPTSATDQLLEKMKANPYAGRSGSAMAKARRLSAQQRSNGISKWAETEGDDFCPTVLSLEGKLEAAKETMSQDLKNQAIQLSGTAGGGDDGAKLLKPISGMDFPSEEIRVLAEILQKDIIRQGLNTKWEDVIGLTNAKAVLKEALVYTKDFADFFGPGLSPWKGLLLFGPPGVGKTMLAKAVATECATTFFNISSSTIVSKWRGESEKMVKVLFDLARYYAPSTIFFDEFDALGSTRDSTGETDATRRLKAEILHQMDGLLTSSNQEQIFVLAATNIPWELDSGILRRLEKRIYIPLPNTAERCALLKRSVETISQSAGQKRNSVVFKIDFEILALKTDSYSCSDLNQIVKETVLTKFRQRYSKPEQCRQLVVQTEDFLSVLASTPPTVKEAVVQKFSNWDSKLNA